MIEDSDCSMGDAADTHKELGLVSDSEAMSDEESDKENQPASPQAAAVKYVSQPLMNLKAYCSLVRRHLDLETVVLWLLS